MSQSDNNPTVDLLEGESSENLLEFLEEADEISSGNLLTTKYFRIIKSGNDIRGSCATCSANLSFKDQNTANLTRHLVSLCNSKLQVRHLNFSSSVFRNKTIQSKGVNILQSLANNEE